MMYWGYLGVVTTLSTMIFCAGGADNYDDWFNAGTVSNDTSNNIVNNYNFGNVGEGDANGDDLWNSGQDVPTLKPQGWDGFEHVTPSVSSSITPGASSSITPIASSSVTPSVSSSVTPNVSSSVTPSVFCHPNYCQVLNPCNGSSKCVNAQECNKTICQIKLKTKTTDHAASPLGDQALPENNCLDVSNIHCPDPTFCFDLYQCQCKPGFYGIKCLQKCSLNCIPDQGACMVAVNASNYDEEYQYCNCLPDWEGDVCDTPVVDPKAAALKAHQKEENARIMAGVLAAAAAVVLCIAIAMPIVLWRMRAIFVLKLVYFFKPFDDDDDKLYDAYVSMTSTPNADKFVYYELRPQLENKGFKLYLQARDNCPGNAISEDIIEAVEKSRCTIMIVTQDYITNEWNRFEYLIAQHESLKLKQRIIPIILEKLDKETTLDKALKHILDSVKCLKYPQQTPTQSSSNETKDTPQEIHFIGNDVCKKSKEEKNCDSSEDKKIIKAEKKFWKCLELTMPKIKKPKCSMNNNLEKPGPLHESVFQQISIPNNICTVNEKCNTEYSISITMLHLSEQSV